MSDRSDADAGVSTVDNRITTATDSTSRGVAVTPPQTIVYGSASRCPHCGSPLNQWWGSGSSTTVTFAQAD
jgi:hypothetical protein